MEDKKAANLALPIIASILWAIVAILAFVPAVMTVMVFDSGTEGANAWQWSLFYGMWGLVILSTCAVPGIWIAWALTRKRDGLLWIRLVVALMPLITIVPITYAWFNG